MESKVIKTSCPRDCFGGCSMKAYVENGRIVKLEGDTVNKATDGKLCIKGMAYKDYVYSPNRVSYPLERTGSRGEGKFKSVSWEHAIDKIGQKLKSIKNSYGPLSVMYYSSGGCQGMLSEYYNGFFSQYGGFTTTRGNLCLSAGSEATKLTYGESKHNAPWDLENARLIILWGKNPAFTNVHEMKYINNAISKGSKLITIDPIKNPSTTKSHLHISPEPGTDIALALGIITLLIQRSSVDIDFIDKYTYGFDMLKEHALKYTPSRVCDICKIKEEELYKIVELIENNSPMTLVCGYGIQRYKNGGQTVRAISMLPALMGDIGIKGGGFRFTNKQWRNLNWPYTKQSDYEIRSEYSASALGNAIASHKDPPIKMLWVERANPLTMNPDINGLKKSIIDLDYIVVIDQFMTDTTRFADIVLPAQSFFEYDDIFTGYWTPYLSYCQRAIEPVNDSKNESQIYRMLGQYMEYDMEYLPEYNKDAIDMVLKHSNINTCVEKLKENPQISMNSDIAFEDRIFHTPSGKIELYCENIYCIWRQSQLPDFIDENTDKSYPLKFLSTHVRERIHSQFKGIGMLKVNEDKVLLYINPKDAAERNISDGDRVGIYNNRGRIYAYASLKDLIKEGVVNIYEGLPEDSGASVNMLTSQETSDIGYGAVYYDCNVEVEKC